MSDDKSLVLQRQRQLKWPALDWLESLLMMLCGFTLACFSVAALAEALKQNSMSPDFTS